MTTQVQIQSTASNNLPAIRRVERLFPNLPVKSTDLIGLGPKTLDKMEELKGNGAFCEDDFAELITLADGGKREPSALIQHFARGANWEHITMAIIAMEDNSFDSQTEKIHYGSLISLAEKLGDDEILGSVVQVAHALAKEYKIYPSQVIEMVEELIDKAALDFGILDSTEELAEQLGLKRKWR